MYNQIPSERTSKRAIFIALLFCITLVSVLTAGYFAWMAKNLQGRIATFETSEQHGAEATAGEEDSVDVSPVVSDVAVPLFTYPQIVQVPFHMQAPEYGTLLGATLSDWEEANKDAQYCTHIRDYITDEQLRASQGAAPVSTYLTDESVRAALRSYFWISSLNEQQFFDGIRAVIDEHTMFAQNATMCTSGNGARKFLLLNNVVDGIPYPEVLEWLDPPIAGDVWLVHHGDYRALDGYTFIPDWEGEAILQTGYGDAGYSNWEVQLLSVNSLGGSLPVVTTLEKCSSAPTPDWSDSLMTCEVEYAP